FDALESLHKAAAIGCELQQPPEWFDQLRNEAIAALALADVHVAHTEGACFVRRVSDDVEIASLPELGGSVTPIFGPGRLLALYQDQRSRLFQLWDLAEPKPILRINERSILGCGFRPDGRLLVLRHGDKNGDFFSVRATGTGLCERRLPPDGNRGRAYVAPHPTEPVVAIGSFESGLFQVRD